MIYLLFLFFFSIRSSTHIFNLHQLIAQYTIGEGDKQIYQQVKKY